MNEKTVELLIVDGTRGLSWKVAVNYLSIGVGAVQVQEFVAVMYILLLHSRALSRGSDSPGPPPEQHAQQQSRQEEPGVPIALETITQLKLHDVLSTTSKHRPPA